jgi:hypothetical protein
VSFFLSDIIDDIPEANGNRAFCDAVDHPAFCPYHEKRYS